MPRVYLRTNLPGEKISVEFHKKLSAKLAEVLNKPPESVWVSVETDLRLSHGGGFQPLCLLDITCIGLNTRELTQPVTEKLTEFIADHTCITPRNIQVVMHEPMPYEVGVNGKVF
ncbi:MIF-like protein mif-2 [Procambarus clarkii]|uniref:MIF-like protein mif-2 n=1 Tax=Procambarus clarkii TaxID=6728 RepID=UPI003743970D